MRAANESHRSWAKKHFRGFENILMPSFTPDLSGLDEEGIRLDIRQSIRHGLFSAFLVPLGLQREERREYYRIAADEAGDEILVSSIVMEPTREMQHAVLEDAGDMGLSHMLIHPFPTFAAATEDDLYEFYRDLIESTDLAVCLWATGGRQFQHIHPSNVALDVYDRLADLPNVMAIKLMATLELPVVYEICERLKDRLLIGGVHLGIAPLLVKHYGMQWSGAWTQEALQSPQQPYVVEYLDHLLHGRDKEAMKIYWHIKPAYDALLGLMAPMLPKGVHPFTHLKYYQWCVGGNGGLLRRADDPGERDFPIKPDERQHVRAAFKSIGITPMEDDDEVFVVGRAAYARGVRAADMPVKNNYV
jgi:4-hydroxy-tetrahydrodipicolinate synthase